MDFLFSSAEYCIAYVLAIATLQSPLNCYSLPLPVLPFLDTCLCLLDLPFDLPCWILFADRRPMLALGLLFVLPVLFLFVTERILLVL